MGHYGGKIVAMRNNMDLCNILEKW